MSRIVCWFSCGAASAYATKLAIEANAASKSPKELVVASIYLQDEHPDSSVSLPVPALGYQKQVNHK